MTLFPTEQKRRLPRYSGPQVPGDGWAAIYILTEGDAVIYVGSSTSPGHRLRAHRTARPGRRIDMTAIEIVTEEFQFIEECRWLVKLYDAGHPLENKGVPAPSRPKEYRESAGIAKGDSESCR